MTRPERWRQLQRVDLADSDYPGTTFRAPTAAVRVRRAPRPIRYVIIHITGGHAENEGGAINTFRNGPASAHYIVNRQGHITQFVRDADIANHVDNIGSRTNRESIGIEHVNQWNAEVREHPTLAQYRASAELVAWLCHRYGIPIVHDTTRHAPGIRGHVEEQPNTGHVNCPNPAWDWDRYVHMVRNVRVESFGDLIDSLAR